MTRRSWIRASHHRALAIGLLLAMAVQIANAQSSPAMAIDHVAMPGMDQPITHDTAPEPDTLDGQTRSPDYSDGIGRSPMPGMDMPDRLLAMLLIDQLEVTGTQHADGQAWQVQGWYGNDSDKLWLRSEGERSGGHIGDGQVEALWSHAVTAFWDTQLGVRQDLGDGPHRRWAAFGIQGLAPYSFELEATAYAGPSGRTAARFRAEYELRFTQRWLLQPEFELNLYGRDDPAQHVGRGLSDTRLGLRLRYEIRRFVAPYVGVVWTQRYGATAEAARLDGHSPMDRQFVAGVRFRF